MALPTVFTYHPQTKEFMGKDTAPIDPEESRVAEKKVYRPNAWSTPIKPATHPAPAGQANVFDESAGKWNLVEDHRGAVYDTSTGAERQHHDLGPLPTNLTDQAPASPFDSWDGAAGAWSFDPVKSAGSRRVAIAGDCRDAITAGRVCNTLGTDHTYPTSERDQANLAAQVLAAQINGASGEPYKFWCADPQGAWARRPHTAAQILAVGEAVRKHVTACQDQYEALTQQLDALAASTTTTKADIAAVTWI